MEMQNEIKNIWRVIDTSARAKETAQDIRHRAELSFDERTDWYIKLCFTGDAYQVFKSELSDITGEHRERVSSVMTEINPVFSGCETVPCVTIEVYADFRNDKTELEIGLYEEFAQRCIKADNEYYSVVNYSRTKGRYMLYRTVQPQVYFRYSDKIVFPERPNLIGVMTPKKLQEWVDYNNKVIKLCEEKRDEIDTKINDFKKRLSKIAPDLVDQRHGHIVKNGIRYSWSLDSDGDVIEKVEIQIEHLWEYDKTKLFKMLSANKFVKQNG